MNAMPYAAFVSRERIRSYTSKLQRAGNYAHGEHITRITVGVSFQDDLRNMPIPAHRALITISPARVQRAAATPSAANLSSSSLPASGQQALTPDDFGAPDADEVPQSYNQIRGV